MAPKKSDYWDQIYPNQSPEADDASQNEENTPTQSSESDTQEHDLNVREILFAEEGPDAAPMSSLQKEFAQETGANPADSNEEETAENESQEEDPFFGWTQTTKVYSSLNFDDVEKPEANEEAGLEADFEAVETEELDENSPEILEEKASEITAEDETENESEEAANEPLLSQDGSLRITLNRYEHPAKGFGFGLLEEAEYSEEEEVEEAAEETSDESALDETPEEVPAAEEPKAPEGLDSWGSLAFELGLPVTIPETAPETAVPKASSKPKKEEKPSKPRRAEKKMEKSDSKIVIDLEDEDFVSPENVYADSAKEVRTSRSPNSERGRREDREKFSDFGLKQVVIPEEENVIDEPLRRRRRRGNTSQEASVREKRDAALSAIVAGVVESKTKDEAEKTGRKSGKGRTDRTAIQDEESVLSTRRERSRRSRRGPVEEIPQDDFVMADEDDFQPQAVQEDETEENAIPNGARSRRRRRAQHEKMEQTKARSAVQAEEEKDEDESEEVSFQPKKRSRRDGRNRFREELEDEKNEWMGIEEDSEEDDSEEDDDAPRGRRQRRSGRSGARNQFQESRVSDEVFEDEEDHVFTEVDDEEDEDEDEWETDFSQHDVPGWRYTIDFIVNSNLKARKREPSSMVENIARMSKRGGKRK